ncbi:MAG: acyl carrier protein [Bacteroidales bacterium]|nr:acyl carrier protein [Bacteroidales bacterium]
MTDIKNELTLIMRRVLKQENLSLKEDFTDRDIEGWDSMAQVELIAEIEEHFNIEFSLKDLPRLNSVKNIIQLIEEKTSSRQ